ncbi:SHOCT domain-containing protein [Candidatus Parcubacteria bacterium]|nr:SHOCT domain-containing protein [Candidatus Parcubacteria bacterium]
MMGGRYSSTGWWGGAWGWLGVLFSVLWWVFAITLVVAAVKWIFGCRGGSHRRSSAHEILTERYAKGEISKQEFEEKKRDLTI